MQLPISVLCKLFVLVLNHSKIIISLGSLDLCSAARNYSSCAYRKRLSLSEKSNNFFPDDENFVKCKISSDENFYREKHL